MKMRISLAVLGLMAAMAVPAVAQDDVAALYKSKCQACHGADGKGATPAGQKMGAKDFHSPEVAKQSDADLIKATKRAKGRCPSTRAS